MVPFARPIGTTVSLRSGGRAALSRACSIRDMRRPNAFFTSAIVKPRRLASGGSSSRRQASSQFFGGPITYSNSSTTPIGVCLEIETFWAKQFVKRIRSSRVRAFTNGWTKAQLQGRDLALYGYKTGKTGKAK